MLTGKYFQTFRRYVLPFSSGSVQSKSIADVNRFYPYLMGEAGPPFESYVFNIKIYKNIQYFCQFTYSLCHKSRLALMHDNWHCKGTLTCLLYFIVLVKSTRR
jgi:hypothetical protein